jgi:Carboxypeptidase regulatory-like domain/Tetratricopeptide repeat/TPR repeat
MRRRVPGLRLPALFVPRPIVALATLLALVVFLSCTLSCTPLAAQRRSPPSPSSFPDDDTNLGVTTRSRSFSISGVVADAESHIHIDGARVDLQSIAGGILSTAFTNTVGNFQFNNVRPGSYELIFAQPGYQDDREHVEVDGPVFGMTVTLRRLSSAGNPGSPTVSVRDFSIPEKARDAMHKGMSLLYQKSDYPGSIKQFQRAIQAYPNYYEAYAQMGFAYMRMKDPDQSEKALRKSIDISEEHYVDAFVMLAALLSSNKRFADAEPLARKAVELDANSWHAQSELAQALMGLKRPGEAENCAQEAIKLQPQNPLLHLLLADVHIELKNDLALLDDFDAYLKLAPNGPYAEQVRQHRDELQKWLQNSRRTPAETSPAEPSPAPSPSASQANP